MSIFYCTECDCYKDADVDGCDEHPMTGKEVCESCYYNIFCELGKD